MSATEPTPRYYVEFPRADYRYRRRSAGWTRSENPMSKWRGTDMHNWDYVDYADLPASIVTQYEADKAALNQATDTQHGINAAIGLSPARLAEVG